MLVKQYRFPIAAALIWIFVLLGSRHYMAVNDLTVNELAAELGDLLADHWYGVLIYIVAYLIRPVLLLPASIITALAGNVWGLGLGFAIGLVAGTLSAVVPYAGGRWFAPDEATYDRIRENETRIGRFVTALKDRPFQAILTMRLLYFPYDTVSAVAGGLRIGFLPFFIATAIGNIAGTFAFVGIGASISGDVTSGQMELDPTVFIFSGVILVGSLVLSRILNGDRASHVPAQRTVEGTYPGDPMKPNTSGD